MATFGRKEFHWHVMHKVFVYEKIKLAQECMVMGMYWETESIVSKLCLELETLILSCFDFYSITTQFSQADLGNRKPRFVIDFLN